MVLGILGSGSGSNMQAILDAIDAGTLDARIALVLSDNPDAFILERARGRGIETGVIDCGGFRTKFPDEAQAETAARLQAAGVELVCLAGFLRLVKRPAVRSVSGAHSQHPSRAAAGIPGAGILEAGTRRRGFRNRLHRAFRG